MNTQHISPYQLKKFLKHLCVVSSHYEKRDLAHQDLKKQVGKLKKADDLEKEVNALHHKIKKVMSHEVKVAKLGHNKHLPHSVMEEIADLKKEVRFLNEVCSDLRKENLLLKEELLPSQSRPNPKNTSSYSSKSKKEKSSGIARQEKVSIIKKSISTLEESLKKLSKEENQSPAKLYKIKEKLKLYKARLKSL